MVRLALIILLILLLLALLPAWPYSAGWGYYPSGGLGLILLMVRAGAFGPVWAAASPEKSARADEFSVMACRWN